MIFTLDVISLTWIYLILINMLAFGLVGWDKRKARKRRWRVPEKRFFFIAFLGGALGVYFGMQQFRHKTQHRKFTIGIPILIIVNIILFYYLILYGFGRV